MIPTAAPPPMDFAAARDRMVDGQIRPNKVTDTILIQAMRTLPRERFLPPALANRAYLDEDIALPGGRALTEPMVIARLVQGLQARPGEKALVVGAGAGYGAALLATLGARVFALEDDDTLLAIARTVLPVLATDVVLAEGPLPSGWPEAAPYDMILIEGAVRTIPEVLVTQLAPQGRLAAVLAEPGGPGRGVLAEAVSLDSTLRLRARPFFECNTPPLPQFAPLPSFTF